MTAPVSTLRQSYSKGEVHEMCFYLFAPNPPNPTADDVFLVKRQAMNVYTRTLEERMSEEDWQTESETLDNLLSNYDLSFNTNQWYANGYSDPWSQKQRNEVWKLKV